MTVIVLMNLLIAMMSDTFFKVADNAEAEYQMEFARLVKSYVTATVLPRHPQIHAAARTISDR